MSQRRPSRLVTASRRLYRLLLQLYPRSFRDTYGPEMLQLFIDCCRDAITARGATGLLGLWLLTLGDLAGSLVREHRAALGRSRPMRRPALAGGGLEPRWLDGLTYRAHTALLLSSEEARALGHHNLHPEHLLLGCLREEGGVAAHVLREQGIELQVAREAVEFLFAPPRGPAIPATKRPSGRAQPKRTTFITPHLRTTLASAAEEARAFGHPYVGTEHLLLALLRIDGGGATGILDMLQVRPRAVRAQVLQIVATSSETNTGSE